MVTTHGHCLCNEHKIKKKKATVDLFLAHKFEGLGICTISRCKWVFVLSHVAKETRDEKITANFSFGFVNCTASFFSRELQ
jgi:hypothetical protein